MIVLGDAIAEILLVGIAAEILEGQHGNRRPLGERHLRSRRQDRADSRNGLLSGAIPDGFVEANCLWRRLDSELRAKAIAQSFVPPQRLNGLARLGLCLHDCPAGRFVERIKQEESPRGLRGKTQFAVGDRIGNGSRQRSFEKMSEAPSLEKQPILERGTSDADILDDFPAVERSRGMERLRRSFAQKPLERRDVRLHRGGIELHRSPVRNDRRCRRCLQAVPDAR